MISDCKISSFEKFLGRTESYVKIFYGIERLEVLLHPGQLTGEGQFSQAHQTFGTGAGCFLTIPEEAERNGAFLNLKRRICEERNAGFRGDFDLRGRVAEIPFFEMVTFEFRGGAVPGSRF